MKLTMKLTLEGLLRALRSRAHAMADEIEAGYAGAQPKVGLDGSDSAGGRGGIDR